MLNSTSVLGTTTARAFHRITRRPRNGIAWQAEQGNANAQNNLGVMYDSGKGVPQSYQEAVKWYRLAAEQGNANAQNNLGAMYGSGKGVPQDFVQAHKWINLAASRTTEKRIDYRSRRDSLEEKMTASQVAEAQRLAMEWKPKTWNQLAIAGPVSPSQEDLPIPYANLESPTPRNSRFLDMNGWEMGRAAHQEYGLSSTQETIVDYRLILDRPKAEVEHYLGVGEGKKEPEGEFFEYVYMTQFGRVEVSYRGGRVSDFSVSLNGEFPGYASALRGVGITKLTKPFAMNRSRLLFNSALGNSLLTDFQDVNVAVFIPEDSNSGWIVRFLQ